MSAAEAAALEYGFVVASMKLRRVDLDSPEGERNRVRFRSELEQHGIAREVIEETITRVERWGRAG